MRLLIPLMHRTNTARFHPNEFEKRFRLVIAEELYPIGMKINQCVYIVLT